MVKIEEFNDTQNSNSNLFIQAPLETQVNKMLQKEIRLTMLKIVKENFKVKVEQTKMFFMSQTTQTKSILTIQAQRAWGRVKDILSHSDKIIPIINTWILNKKGPCSNPSFVNSIILSHPLVEIPSITPPLVLTYEQEVCISITCRGRIHVERSAGQAYYVALSNNGQNVSSLEYLRRFHPKNLSFSEAFFNASELGLIDVGTGMENCLFAALYQRSMFIASKRSNAKVILAQRGANGQLLTSVLLRNEALGHKDIFLTKEIEKEDLFLIIADGIWDTMNETTASTFVINALLLGCPRDDIAKQLVNELDCIANASAVHQIVNGGVVVIFFKQSGVVVGPRDFMF